MRPSLLGTVLTLFTQGTFISMRRRSARGLSIESMNPTGDFSQLPALVAGWHFTVQFKFSAERL
jgi:hypothetical protein